MITRRSNKEKTTSRADAIRAKRKQQETYARPSSAKKVVSQIRSVVEDALPRRRKSRSSLRKSRKHHKKKPKK